MKNIKLTIQYDGTNYSGWQIQNNAITVQEVMEKAILKATGEKVKLIGCSRTDSKVHAREYICNFFIETRIPAERFNMVVNSYLPEDVVILNSKETDEKFHSRFSSKGKTYIYTVFNSKKPTVIGRNYFYYFKYDLDIDKMRKASQNFIGTHDFSAFKTKGGNVKTSIRTITECSIKVEGNFIKFTVSGDGFLYNMVRIMVGTLIEVGIGKIEPESIKSIIDSKDRKKAGKCAPGKGLCLEKVFY
ncbi:tRNA pseudouridine(38-40) synthase TruA [Clostridium oceanicum]|uniref:tRNA pseudouridine synthase A n=1 Tax=Clostridium oceanicum TaxID=1543 RepID=A0ABP3UL06_9CLOT